MHPYLFKMPLPGWLPLVGGNTFRLPSYGFMIAVGFLLCLYLLGRRGPKMGLDPAALFDMAIVVLLAGIVGARLFYVIHHWGSYSQNPLSIIRIDKGGLAFYGGLIGGGLALLAMVRLKELPLRQTLDVVVSLIPLGHAFGRVGCFLNGCCFGKVTDVWSGLRFPYGSPPHQHQMLTGWPLRMVERIRTTFSPAFVEEFGAATRRMGDRFVLLESRRWSLPIHPTQLYEVGYNLVIFGVLSYLLTRRRRAGNVAFLYPVLYCSARFVNEYYRADTLPRSWLGGLTVFQAIGAAAAVWAAAMLLDSRRRPAEAVPESWQPPEDNEG